MDAHVWNGNSQQDQEKPNNGQCWGQECKSEHHIPLTIRNKFKIVEFTFQMCFASINKTIQ